MSKPFIALLVPAAFIALAVLGFWFVSSRNK